MSNNCIWPRYRTHSGATIPGLSERGSDGNEGVLRIPQISSITGASSSDCLVSFQGYSLREWGESYSSAKILLVYFNLVLSSVLFLVTPYVFDPQRFLQYLAIHFNYIYSFWVSVVLFLFPYLAPGMFCSLCLWLPVTYFRCFLCW